MRYKIPVTVYTHDGCLGGQRAIAFFQKQNNVMLSVKDVLSDQNAKEEFTKRQGIATPLIDLDGYVITGFEEETFIMMLTEAGGSR